MTEMAKPARRYRAALEKHYRFLLWLVPTVEKFPRAQKFTLGDRTQSAALDLLDGLTEANYSRDCAPALVQVPGFSANTHHGTLSNSRRFECAGPTLCRFCGSLWRAESDRSVGLIGGEAAPLTQ